tara:strand:+ start:341 stop:532 length:192 start_codon:yes stop_codon:yes gene_type:complete
MNTYNYKTHIEIPKDIKEYMVSVSDTNSITDIPVEDINVFLNDQEEYFNDLDNQTLSEENEDV